MIKHLLAILMVFVIPCSMLNADLTFEASSTSDGSFVMLGSTGTLTFSVNSDTDTTQEFNSFALGFIVTGVGGADISNIEFSNAVSSVAGFTLLPGTLASLGGGSFGITGAGPGVAIGERIDLVTVDFEVTGGTSGAFNIDVTTVFDGGTPVTPALSELGGAGDLGVSFAASPEATLSFAAVPEPSSSMILAGIACLGALRRRRTR